MPEKKINSSNFLPCVLLSGLFSLGLPGLSAAFTMSMVASLDSVYQIDLKNHNGEVEQYQCVGFRERNSRKRMNLFFDRNDLNNRAIINLANYVSASIRKVALTTSLTSISRRTYPNSQAMVNNLKLKQQKVAMLLDISTTMEANYMFNGPAEDRFDNEFYSEGDDVVAMQSSEGGSSGSVSTGNMLKGIEAIDDLQKLEIISRTILNKIEKMSEAAKVRMGHNIITGEDPSSLDEEKEDFRDEEEGFDSDIEESFGGEQAEREDHSSLMIEENETGVSTPIESSINENENTENESQREGPYKLRGFASHQLNSKPWYAWEQAIVVDWEKSLVKKSEKVLYLKVNQTP